ncbi:MAG: purine-nucleoside phosphorylase, partial [Bdellovibrionales bacterium]|nr:purine-nucleoside phosphorylase [Bdellovibrionales bacterium]
SFSDLPHFPPPTVDGHPGKLLLGRLGETPVAVLQGRIHYYEGHSPEDVVLPTRVLAGLGVETLILTNAAGGLNPKMKPGDFMVLNDHINLMGYNPLRGKNIEEWGPRFPDMSEVYDLDLRRKLITLLNQLGVSFHEGVYCGVSGPTYETPAEVRYLGKIGGGAVGMSTVSEALAARHMGLKVVGISCITNLAAGISPHPLTHEEVKETAKMVEAQFSQFLRSFVEGL